MGSDGCDAEGDGGVPPSSGLSDRRDVISASWVGGVGLVVGDRGLGGGGDVAN